MVSLGLRVLQYAVHVRVFVFVPDPQALQDDHELQAENSGEPENVYKLMPSRTAPQPVDQLN